MHLISETPCVRLAGAFPFNLPEPRTDLGFISTASDLSAILKPRHTGAINYCCNSNYGKPRIYRKVVKRIVRNSTISTKK